MSGERSEAYAAEIRTWLLGRLQKAHSTGAIEAQKDQRLRHQPFLAWWVFEGKRYDMLDGPLCSNWDLVDRRASRLLRSYNPVWRISDAPEGETDWVASSFSTLTSGRESFVTRASAVGLGAAEREALVGWLEWLRQLWEGYCHAFDPPAGTARELPWPARPRRPIDARALRRWAHTARRSRWPLLRSLVADSLRATFDPELVDSLPLPTDHATLFELVCIVRLLRAIVPQPTTLRWFDLKHGKNRIELPGFSMQFQETLSKQEVLDTAEFSHGLREAVRHQGLGTPKWIDGLLRIEKSDGGFAGVVIEAKSGAQGPEAAVYQLKSYRAAVRAAGSGPLLVMGVTEQAVGEDGLVRRLEELRSVAKPVERDFWVFCSAEDVGRVAEAAGLTTNDVTRWKARVR